MQDLIVENLCYTQITTDSSTIFFRSNQHLCFLNSIMKSKLLPEVHGNNEAW